MANLIDWSLIEARVDLNINSWNYEKRSNALAHILLENQFNLSPEEIYDSITDGANDRGVDAVYIDEEKITIHIFQFKYVEKIEKAKNNFPSNEIDKILSFISDLLSKSNILQTTCNPLLWSKVQDIWEIFLNDVPNFEIHFCGNMAGLVKKQLSRIESSLQPYRYFTVREHTINSIVNLILEKQQEKIDGELHLIDKQYFERTDGNIRGLIATIPASELINLIKDPENPDSARTVVFNDNVRIYLGTKNNPINKKIYDSALSKAPEFWYLNNGITLTCSSFNYPPSTRSPLVKICNYQIVNGGQTSNALFEAYKTDEEKINDVLILVKIYETKESDLSQRIAESTNSQTPIKSRDLHSNDEIQLKIADEFNSMGYYYERKTNQFRDKEKAKRIDAQMAGQVYLAYYLDFPEVAKKSRGRVFGDLYDLIFNPEINAKKMLVPIKIFSPIDKTKRDVQNSMRRGDPIDTSKTVLIDGNYHVLFTVACLCKKKGIDIFDSKKASALLGESIDIVNEITNKQKEKVEKSGGLFRSSTFFKDKDTKILIQHRIMGSR